MILNFCQVALKGIVSPQRSDGEDEDPRELLLKRTSRFHFVREVSDQVLEGEVKYFKCDCRDYFFRRWCLQSGCMQHRDQLRLLDNVIPKSRWLSSTIRKSFRVAKAVDAPAVKRRSKELDGKQATKKNFVKK
jgi:hypothetical protein